MRWWMAHYRHDGGFGCEYRMLGRALSVLRAALGGKPEKHDELRFTLSYQDGDEYEPDFPLTHEEIAERLERVGFKKVTQ